MTCDHHVATRAARAQQSLLCGSAAIRAIAAATLTALALPAAAQDAPQGAPATTASPSPQNQAAPAPAPQDQSAADDTGTNDIVVTGTLFRRIDTETPSPVTTLTADNLAKAGITNVTDAVRSISADNSGSIPTAFTGGFGAGGAAVSLRGLGVSSTLVLIDGMRTANFPLNDDGVHAFVDLNSVPFSIIDRVEVLKDGASSTYGADAIGGVVNLIMRKHITGVEGSAEAGISERGDADSQRATLTAGFGDFQSQGWNAYVNGEYERNGPAFYRDRAFPFDTNDLTSIGGINNELGTTTPSSGTAYAVVQRSTQTDPNNPLSGGVPFGPYQLLNPGACPQIYVPSAPGGQSCAQNYTQDYGWIAPKQRRYSFTGRISVRVGDRSEAYATASYFNNFVFAGGTPRSIRNQQPTGATPALSALQIVLPVYVCAAGVDCATAADRRLNPNNPFAASGTPAAIFYRFGDIPFGSDRENQVWRGALGLKGELAGGWSYAVEASGAKSTLTINQYGFPNVQGLLKAINTGAYNFVNPDLNSQAVRDLVAPTVTTDARSELYMLQATVTKDLLTLPGGPLQFGVGGSVRREILDDPNQNANLATYGLNTFSASGRHTVAAGFFELNAPVLKNLEVDVSGRYDHYSEGFGNFSPKIGAKFSPIREIAIRGTYSRGFRAPGFAEIGQSQFVGFTAYTPPCDFRVQHGAPAGCATNGGNPYNNAYRIGYSAAANPNLRPEKSRSFTGGIVLQPAEWLSFTADYYNIRKTDIVAAGPLAAQALAAYYAGTALPAGYSIAVVDSPDPLYPGALARPLIVNTPFVNGASLTTSGMDLALLAKLRLSDGVKLTSKLEVSEIFAYNFKPDATSPMQHYVGTQGPYQLSSGAGTPRWRGNWQNTLDIDPFALTLTTYYVSGYKNVSDDTDQGIPKTTCANNLYGTGDKFCRTKGFWDVDLNLSAKAGDRFTFYLNVYNLLDVGPAFSPASYSAVNYVPTWSYQGIIGRSFRAGVSAKF